MGWTRHTWWSSANDSERRKLASQEIREAEEEKRLATAVGQVKQGAWTRWESVEQRNISWSVLWEMELLRISFLWKSTYDLFPTPANLSSWYDDKSDCCHTCGRRGNLQHILRSCPSSLSSGLYTWRHNNVLKVVVDVVEHSVQKANLSDDSNSAVQFINFVSEGRGSGSYGISSKRRNILTAANDWEITAYLSGGGTFPVEVAITNYLKPDIVIWSASQQQVILGELTVPWEDNIQEAYERKYTKYTELKAVCVNRGWKAILATHLRSDAEVLLQQPSRSGYVTWVLVEGR